MYEMNRDTGVHWKTPTLVIWCLTTGVAFALGHHFWYASIAGKEVTDGQYIIANHNLSRQQVYVAVGTAFAFLVKTALVAATSITYIQLAWRAIRTAARGTKLRVLDTLFSILGNAFLFVRLQIWLRYPLLLLLGLFTWLIPLASIITPGTLSVQSVPILPSVQMMNLPRINFESLNYHAPLNDATQLDKVDQYYYNGIGQELGALTIAVLTQGRVIDMPFAQSNASWTSSFFGPALQCGNPTSQEYQNITRSIIKPLNISKSSDNECDAAGAWIWVPLESDVSIANPGNSSSDSSFAAALANDRPMDNGIFSFFGVMLPPTKNTSDCRPWETTSSVDEAFKRLNGTIFKCTFFNTSYTTQTDIVNGLHQVRYTRNITQETMKMNSFIYGPKAITTSLHRGNSTLGQQQSADAACSTLNDQGTECLYDPVVVRTMAYQSIIISYMQILVGTIVPGALQLSTSKLTNTVLMNTNELMNYPDPFLAQGEQSLQTLIGQSKGVQYADLMRSSVISSHGPLTTALEDNFSNLTLSLLSNPLFQTEAQPTTINTTTYHNVYIYNSSTLWIAYGSAIAVTAVVSLLGLLTMFMTSAAYDNYFSTVVRVGRTARLTEEVTITEGSGKAPLSKRLAKASLIINHRVIATTSAENRKAPSQHWEEVDPEASTDNIQLLHRRGES